MLRKKKQSVVFMLLLLGAVSCSENALTESTSATEKEFTIAFQAGKGKLHPVNGFNAACLSQEQSHNLFYSGCITTDRMIFSANKKMEAVAVAEGQILKTAYIKGIGFIVISRHGDYTTVYTTLDTIYVRDGDKISKNKLIGEAGFANNTRGAEIGFEIYHSRDKLNPREWIAIN